MVQLEARAIGKKRPLIPTSSVPIPLDPGEPGDGSLTLRDLIEAIVRTEVKSFRKRQDARLFLRVLSPKEIQDSAEQGRVDPGGRALGPIPVPDEAVTAALSGFEDGLYLVLVDGVEQKQLDQQVHATDSTRVTFLRLTFLAGA